MHPILFVIFSGILLLLISGGYVFFVACRRTREINWLSREEVANTPYGVFYDQILAANNWLQQHSVQDVFISSRDGLRLHGLWLPADNAKGTVLLVHGYRSTYLLDFSVAMDVYHDLGFNLLIPDQRAHGKSEGKYITFGVKERGDIHRWILYHNEVYGKVPLILSGLSMGASTVLYLAGVKLPENVKGIVADCGFTSPAEIIKNVFRAVLHLPSGPSVAIASLFARLFAGFSLYEMDTRRTLAASRLPVLMIHGLADVFVPNEMTRQGYDACRSQKQLLLVAGADHGVSFLSDPVGYSAALLYFIKTNIENYFEK